MTPPPTWNEDSTGVDSGEGGNTLFRMPPEHAVPFERGTSLCERTLLDPNHAFYKSPSHVPLQRHDLFPLIRCRRTPRIRRLDELVITSHRDDHHVRMSGVGRRGSVFEAISRRRDDLSLSGRHADKRSRVECRHCACDSRSPQYFPQSPDDQFSHEPHDNPVDDQHRRQEKYKGCLHALIKDVHMHPFADTLKM